MPRPKTHSRESIVDRALPCFWRFGYGGTSIDDLVRETGVSRQAIYLSFSDKRDLFIACLDLYRETVVTPAFGGVEQASGAVSDILDYFEIQIAKAEACGLPGPGCLFANTMTEVAPHDAGIENIIAAHNHRLRVGFANALRDATTGRPDPALIADLAALLTASAHGLWSMSRVTDNAAVLRRVAKSLIELVQRRLGK